MVELFLRDRVALHAGDCRDVLAEHPADHFDAAATDAPYHLISIVKRFAKAAESDATITSQRVRDRSDGYARLVSGGFMGCKWDDGDIAFRPEAWAAVFRVLKPGAHLVAFGGTRTYHRLACAIEDAGFEIRDCVQWLYSQGFPKSHAVEIAEWDGWGTALKPACELIVLARKPLSENTIAANVLRWGTGALNIGACRIEARGETIMRWPANVIHDGSDEVAAAFPDVAARFFYTAKADADDRLGSKHPTIKPVDLLQYLVRLITPKGGIVLDPFAGTGTTGEAAWREGMRAVLIEREDGYCADIRRRMALVMAGPDERRRESIRHKMNGGSRDDGPLFAERSVDFSMREIKARMGEIERGDV